MADASLQKAQLIAIDPATKQALLDKDHCVTVHFNPESLKLSYSVTVKADTGSQNKSDQAAQQASTSSAKLAVDLVFDTTDIFEQQQDAADVVKSVTSKIVSLFVAPPAPDNAKGSKPIPANPCLFLWGTFHFTGLVESYNETLEFFSASGVPLRAAVSISLVENRFKLTNTPPRQAGKTQPLPAASHIGPALTAAGADPTDWRGTALANGLETPRFSALGAVNVDIGAGIAASAGPSGFSVGASTNLGTTIPGAFSASSVSSGGGFGASASVGTGFSVG
jgi:hypothetical protein